MLNTKFERFQKVRQFGFLDESDFSEYAESNLFRARQPFVGQIAHKK